jgi:putative FmdB family regulatory protein
MPIYEYRCSECNSVFEKLQSFAAPQICQCPECGKEANRIVSLGSFILKGTGWYVTDHPSNSRIKNSSESKTESLDTKTPKTDKPSVESSSPVTEKSSVSE